MPDARRHGKFRLTMRADPPDESLCDDRLHTRGEKIRLDAHVEQSRDRRDRTVRVQRREDEVPGQRRLDRRRQRFGVSNLTDHNDVGILAKDGPQPFREREAGLLVDLALIGPRELVLDRILDRRDVLP